MGQKVERSTVTPTFLGWSPLPSNLQFCLLWSTARGAQFFPSSSNRAPEVKAPQAWQMHIQLSSTPARTLRCDSKQVGCATTTDKATAATSLVKVSARQCGSAAQSCSHAKEDAPKAQGRTPSAAGTSRCTGAARSLGAPGTGHSGGDARSRSWPHSHDSCTS